jgi:hypothetical protein
MPVAVAVVNAQLPAERLGPEVLAVVAQVVETRTGLLVPRTPVAVEAALVATGLSVLAALAAQVL